MTLFSPFFSFHQRHNRWYYQSQLLGVAFLTIIFFTKMKVLALKSDSCCHIAICLRLILFYCTFKERPEERREFQGVKFSRKIERKSNNFFAFSTKDFIIFYIFPTYFWRHDTHYNDTQLEDDQHNNRQMLHSA
jgi:hypothetical protein